MPHVDPANYPVNLPIGASHEDADPTDVYRLPLSLDDDYYISYDTASSTWKKTTAPGVALTAITEVQELRGMAMAAIRENRDLDRRLQTLQNAPAPQQVAAAAAPRSTIRIHAPRAFTGVANDKGVYEPTPRDFVRNVRNYLNAEQNAANNVLNDDRKIIITSTLLDQSAAMWYEQIVIEHERFLIEYAADNTLVYTGPLRSLDIFLHEFLRQFEDVDIQKTAIFKIQTMQQGAQSAEVHTRLFKDWAGHTGFNDTALIELYKKSLKPAIRDKVNGQGKHRPTTLSGWYDDAVLFDRQWREDHPDRQSSQPAASNTSTRNNSGQQTRAPQQPQQTPARGANQWQPRNGQFRPWTQTTPAAQTPRNNNGPQPMDIDAVTHESAFRARACFKCGKVGHIARDCRTSQEEIRRTFGRDSMLPPPRFQARTTEFANVDEFAGALSQQDREALLRALQTGGATDANPAPTTGQQGFASGSA